MRPLFALALTAAMACGDTAPTFELFYIRARAPSGMEGAGPAIVSGAVDRIDLIVDPADNGTFMNFNYPPFEDDQVVVRRTSAGEYQISLGLGWIEANEQRTDNSWFVDIPLYVDGEQSVLAPDPDVTVRFVQFAAGGEEEIGSAVRVGLAWPPEPGTTVTLPLTCRAGYDTECLTPTP